MSISDPIADMLTRIRNTTRNRGRHVSVLNSKVCRGIADVLKAEGYISGYEVVDDGRQGKINISLKYGPRGEVLINDLSRCSKPGRRLYAKVEEIPSPVQGLGISIVSTSRGVLSDRMCRDQKIGGELLCTVS